MKTKKQINDVANAVPIGTIMEVPEDFIHMSFLEMKGQTVPKDEYPQLTEALEITPFDRGKNLILDDSLLTVSEGKKLVVKAL